jgi:hypothetical protein
MQHTTERIDCQENGQIVTESGYLAKGFGLHLENELREVARVELHFERSVDLATAIAAGAEWDEPAETLSFATRRADL